MLPLPKLLKVTDIASTSVQKWFSCENLCNEVEHFLCPSKTGKIGHLY
jgi:hypothetical protein